jgi:hypothetical protein
MKYLKKYELFEGVIIRSNLFNPSTYQEPVINKHLGDYSEKFNNFLEDISDILISLYDKDFKIVFKIEDLNYFSSSSIRLIETGVFWLKISKSESTLSEVEYELKHLARFLSEKFGLGTRVKQLPCIYAKPRYDQLTHYQSLLRYFYICDSDDELKYIKRLKDLDLTEKIDDLQIQIPLKILL